MDRTLGEWGRKGIGHWVNGIENPIKTKQTKRHNTRKQNKPHQPTIKPQYKKKTTTPDGVGEK